VGPAHLERRLGDHRLPRRARRDRHQGRRPVVDDRRRDSTVPDVLEPSGRASRTS
jgi:hypothetical protein